MGTKTKIEKVEQKTLEIKSGIFKIVGNFENDKRKRNGMYIENTNNGDRFYFTSFECMRDFSDCITDFLDTVFLQGLSD